MKLFKFTVLATLCLALSAASAMAADGRYVILMKGNKISKNLEANIEAAGGTLVNTMPQVGIAIATSSNENFAGAARNIKGVANAGLVGAWSLPNTTNLEVALPEPAGPTANDTYFNNGWLWGIDRVGAPAAWANGHTGSHDTVVAVIDTGVAWNHPDLTQNVVDVQCITSVMHCNPYPGYSNHGTHVAGTIAAAFDQLAIVGVAPDVGIAGYNVFEIIDGCGFCAYSDSRWTAMIDAADNGYQVLSMSLGGYVELGGPGSNETAAYIQAEKKVANYVKRQGSMMVASAGNDGVNTNGGLMHVPGDIPQMVNVSATGIQPIPRYPAEGSFDILAFYSNSGAATDIAGPGGDCGEVASCSGADVNGYWYGEFFIWSTIAFVDPICAATYDCPLGYGASAGTSMATPHVSGVAALIFDANPGIGPGEVKDILKSSAENIGSRQSFGAGMVRADLATD
jgi:subtilisin family serine protease